MSILAFYIKYVRWQILISIILFKLKKKKTTYCQHYNTILNHYFNILILSFIFFLPLQFRLHQFSVYWADKQCYHVTYHRTSQMTLFSWCCGIGTETTSHFTSKYTKFQIFILFSLCGYLWWFCILTVFQNVLAKLHNFQFNNIHTCVRSII